MKTEIVISFVTVPLLHALTATHREQIVGLYLAFHIQFFLFWFQSNVDFVTLATLFHQDHFSFHVIQLLSQIFMLL